MDKTNFSAKIQEISQSQNITLRAFIETKEGHELLVFVPLFIGAFYQGVQDDENTKDIFHILAEMNITQLKIIDALLAFYFFKSMEYMYNLSLLRDEKVLLPLRAVWEWRHDKLKECIAKFNSISFSEFVSNFPQLLGSVHPELDSIFIFNHLNNAMKFLFKN